MDETAPFKLHDIVETVKGAKFWGEVIAFDTDRERPGCTVMAIAPGFEGTKHVYPLAQLRLRQAQPLTVEILNVPGLLTERQYEQLKSMIEAGRGVAVTDWPSTRISPLEQALRRCRPRLSKDVYRAQLDRKVSLPPAPPQPARPTSGEEVAGS